MKWSVKEDEIVCKFYMKNVNDWRMKIDVVMDELKNAGFINRDVSSTKMRISNFAYLHTGVGLSNASKQSQNIYNAIIKQ